MERYMKRKNKSGFKKEKNSKVCTDKGAEMLRKKIKKNSKK
jgi:hypothetical protein